MLASADLFDNPERPFRNQGGTYVWMGWLAGLRVIPSRCSKPCWRPHVDPNQPAVS